MKKSVLLVLLLAWLAPAQAETAAVVIEADGAAFTLNRGQAEGVNPGDRWQVYRNGSRVGEAVVDSVAEYTARASMLPGSSFVQAGDLVSTGSVTGWSSASEAAPRVASRTLGGQSRERAEDAYRDLLNDRTQGRGFETPTPANTADTMQDVWSAYHMYDLVSTQWTLDGAYVGDPSMIMWAVGGMISDRNASHQMYDGQTVRVDVEVTYWDEELMDRYSDYVAAREATTVEQALQLKSSLYAQKGVGEYTVFEVRLKNVGRVAANLKPFKWHMYLMGPDGRPLEAVRYDASLDSQLNPEQEVAGNVYFPRAGGAQDKLVVVFENMFGDRGNLEFEP